MSLQLPVWLDSYQLAAALLTGWFFAWVALQLVPARPSLTRRVRPYTRATMVRLGKAPTLIEDRPDALVSASTLAALFAPLVGFLLKLFRSGASDAGLLRRLKQSRLYPTLTPEQALTEFRGRQVSRAVGGFIGGMFLGYLFTAGSPNAGLILLLGVICSVMAVWLLLSSVDKQIEVRRSLMRIELFTLNQMMAMDMRIGTGVNQTLTRLARRSSGEVVEEIKEVLANNRAGMDLSEALLKARDETPEPHVARLLETMERVNRRGKDARPTELLLALAEDIRSERREDLQRAAAKARFRQIFPIIVFIAPTMILLISAPLPSLVFENL